MSSRQSRLQTDVETAVQFLSEQVPFVSDVSYSDQCLTFRCRGKELEDDEGCVMTVCLNDDYPDGTVVESSKGPKSVSVLNCQLAVIINDLLSDWFACHGVQQAFLPVKTSHSSQSEITDVAGIPYESQDSYVSAVSDQSDEFDYYNDDDDVGAEVVICPLLEADMKRLKQAFGDMALTYRDFGSIDDIDVELNIDMHFLEEEIARAWKVHRDEPVVVRLHFSICHYLDGGEPKVEVFQLSQKEKFGLGCQLKSITDSFLHQSWKTLSNRLVTEAVERRTKDCPQIPHPQSRTSCPNDDETVARLSSMGFSVEMVTQALAVEQGDIDSALNLLLSSPERFISTHSTGMEVVDLGTGVESSPDLELSASRKKAKVLPSLEYGFLVQLMRYLLQRIPTLNEFCVICDEPHVFQNGAMLKPSVCSRELCVFGYQQLGVMADATDDIATGAEVIALLVAMASAAVRSHRKAIIFDPFPTVVHPHNKNQFAFHPERKDYDRVLAAFDAIPSVREILQSPSYSDLKRQIDEKDQFAYPLFQWIISSNRSHIVKLPKHRMLKSMVTCHQFLLLSSPPAKESAFRLAKKTHGSTFAFHGSNIENWHSIMRNGLLNASGTKYQTHGAAYGSGIYLSPNSSVSFGYSQISGTVQSRGAVHPRKKSSADSRFVESKELRCIALCEVITSSQLRRNSSIWVMPNQDHVCTRFFFVYEEGHYHCVNITTEQQAFQEEIQKALAVTCSN